MKSHLAFKKKQLSLGTNLHILKDHDKIKNRFTKTLYYGKSPSIDRPSLSLTDLSVQMFGKAVSSNRLDFLDMEYASQVGRNACISPCSMMLAMVYIERLRTKNPEYIQTVASSDLFLVSMMIASKFLNDEGEDDEVLNSEWAESAHMEIKYLNRLEREFLAAISWEIFVSPSDFFETMNNVETRVALLEGQKRGWLSYTDIDILMKHCDIIKNWKLIKENLIQVMMICSVAYTAAICVLVGSTAIVSSGIQLAQISTILDPPTNLSTLHFNDYSLPTKFEYDVPNYDVENENSTVDLLLNDNFSDVKELVIETNAKHIVMDNENCKCSPDRWKNHFLPVRAMAVCS